MALTLAERVAFQRAIEEIYWRHRIWPNARSEKKPSFDQAIPSERIEGKVHEYLNDGQLLDDLWHETLSPQRLQAEMDRMARETKRPAMLEEIFSALDHDPQVIAECLVRPALSRQRLVQRYAGDERMHGELRRSAEANLQTLRSVAGLKGTNGVYREIDWIRSETEKAEGIRTTKSGLELNREEWEVHQQTLAGIFREIEAGAPTFEVGKISHLQEDKDRFYAVAVLEEAADHVRLGIVEWLKEPFDGWRQGQKVRQETRSREAEAGFNLPQISAGSGCTDDTWKPTLNVPSGRYAHTAVWTGSEMIVWGGFFNNFPNYLKSGERYDPVTDIWTSISEINAPTARESHTAIWTGSEMIVWGGVNRSSYFETGGRYNPSTDGWVATSTRNAPAGRQSQTAVWTGSEMIVWGGIFYDGSSFRYPITGGRYLPMTDTWLPTSTIGAPIGRYFHTMVWTGTETIVWGGLTNNGTSQTLDTGGRYNPITDSWLSTSQTNAPESRYAHSAVWTGSDMIVWGRNSSNTPSTGGRYDPIADSWSPISASNAPAERSEHTAVWSGTEMIIWGGSSSSFTNAGGRYNPSTDTWRSTNATFSPQTRSKHTAVWTGNAMIVFGGGGSNTSNTGGRYDPASDSWFALRNTNAPEARSSHTSIWTGSEMVVWGGIGAFDFLKSGGLYDPATDTWRPTVPPSLAGRSHHTAVWTGNEMIVWGGWSNPAFANVYYNDGARFNPALNQWSAIAPEGAPAARRYHSAVWTGADMIVWGGDGYAPTYLDTGGKYNLSSNSWTPISSTGAPFRRAFHSAIWTGQEMIIWGRSSIGGKYDPFLDRWTPTSVVNAPTPISDDNAVWTGTEMIVWTGIPSSQTGSGGGRYNPTTDTWLPISTTNQPTARSANTAVWTGHELIVWGGQSTSNLLLTTGGRYNPTADNWTATTPVDAPAKRVSHTAVWTGAEMVIWGGYDGTSLLNIGERYTALPPPPVLGAASRLSHGAAGEFDIGLPLSGTPGIECRSGGGTNDFTLVVTFPGDVEVNGSPQAAVSAGNGQIGSGGTPNGGIVLSSGNIVVVPLTNVADAQTLLVTLYCVNGGGNLVIPMSRLLGDTTGGGSVNASDVSETKGQSGQPVSAANFRSDVNANGAITSSDVGQVKAQSGRQLP